MSATQDLTIPYEKQADAQSNRMCGAASLSMVYRSFGQAVAQADVWPKIAKVNRAGSLTAATHLMAKDALHRGFAALAVQAKHPLQTLRLCQDHGIRAILNHRLREDGPAGHYTVLVGVDGDQVVVHDPYFGPARAIPPAALLDLWRPRFLNAEIVGHVLIGIAAQPAPLPPCALCGTAIPPSVECPGCGQPVPLQPAALLGCVGAGCPARMWNYVCCPYCDHTWNFALGGPEPEVPASPEAQANRFEPLFAQLDKFSSFVRGLPEADDPDVLKQLDYLQSCKDQLKLAQAEELAQRKRQQAQMAQLEKKSRQEEEAILKKREEINKPAPPLDGNALGLALVLDLHLLEDPAQTGKGTAPVPGGVSPPKRPGSPNGAAAGEAARSQSVAPQPSKDVKPEPPPARGDRGEFDSWIP
jgi:Papain-like cysteine protease AvrRpt2